MPKLHELAHCRAGDKGDTSILSLIAYRAEDYPRDARDVEDPEYRAERAAMRERSSAR